MLHKRSFTTMFAAVILMALFMGQLFAPSQLSVARAQTTPISFDNTLRISPDGHYVAYVTAQNLAMAGSTIWLGSDDGSDSTVLVSGDVNNTYWVTSPVWSPDSQQIAYVKVIKGQTTQLSVGFGFEIWAIQRNGTNNRLLTNSSAFSPMLGYGGETDIAWVSSTEIDFSNQSVSPVVYYSLNPVTLAIQVRATGVTPPPSVQASISGVPMFYQTSGGWENDVMNGQTDCDDNTGQPAIIRIYGCAVTSTAMVLNYYGYKISGQPINPGNLNTLLGSTGGYDGCMMTWNLQGVNSGITTSGPIAANLQTLQTNLSQGTPVLLWYFPNGIMHFVVATGYNGSTINVNNPISGATNLAFSQVSGMVIIKGTVPPPPPGFHKTSPANGSTSLNTTGLTLSWQTTDRVKYYYCVEPTNGSAPCPSDVRDWDMTYNTSEVWNHPLNFNTQYRWQVQAWFCKNCSTNINADDGTWWTFTTKSAGASYTISGNAGVAAATLTYSGALLSGTTTSGSDGSYSISVPSGWTGTVTPSQTGVEFTPASTTYANVTSAQAANYQPVFISTPAEDGWILESAASSGVGGTMNSTQNLLYIGDNAANQNYRSILSFNTAGLPDNATITSAVIKVRQSANIVGDPFGNGYLRIDIKQGAFGSSNALELGDYQVGSSQGQVSVLDEVAVNSWYSGILNTGLGYINKTGITQFRLRFIMSGAGIDNNQDDYIKFLSGNYTVNRPQLIITYTLP